MFILTGLYSTLLVSVMVFRGCSANVGNSKGSQFVDGASGAERTAPPDAPADPDGTPSPVSKVPDTPKTDLPEELVAPRNRVAEAECSNVESTLGALMKKSLDLLKCRVEEQRKWFENPLLYDSPGTTHSCVTQSNEVHTRILTYVGKDEDGDGSMWLENACKAATDKALENLNAENRVKIDKTDIPTDKEIKRALHLVLTKFEEFDADPDGDEDSHNIRLMLDYSLNRINHNCAAHIDTENFLPRKIRPGESRGSAEVAYVFREFRNWPDGGKEKIDPVFGRYWDVLSEKIDESKVYGQPYRELPFKFTPVIKEKKEKSLIPASLIKKTDGQKEVEPITLEKGIETMLNLWSYLNRKSEPFTAPTETGTGDEKKVVLKPSLVSTTATERAVPDNFGDPLDHKASRDIIPIRKIDTECEACKAYLRHYKSVGGGTSGNSYTFFDHSDFDIEINVSEAKCSGDGFQKRVVSTQAMCEGGDDEDDDAESDALVESFGNCKFYKKGAPDAASNTERGIECFTRELSGDEGTSLKAKCDKLRKSGGIQPEYKEDYCEFGNSKYAKYHAVGGKPSSTDGHPTGTLPANHKDNYVCHWEQTEADELKAEKEASHACVFTLPFNPGFANGASKQDTKVNLARFLGMEKADIGKCQAKVSADQFASDYKQYDLCAVKYTFYLDSGDGEKLTGQAKTNFAAKFDTDFNTARSKYCYGR